MFVHNGISQIKENGYNIFYYENGEISSEGTLKNGQPDGFWKTYYENGEIKTEGKRTNFLLDSIWNFYYENGKIYQRITYKENKKNGLLSIYNNKGTLLEEKEGDKIFW